jgi:hypothetical protein
MSLASSATLPSFGLRAVKKVRRSCLSAEAHFPDVRRHNGTLDLDAL